MRKKLTTKIDPGSTFFYGPAKNIHVYAGMCGNELPQMHTQLMLLKLKVSEMYPPLGDTAVSQLTGYGGLYISQVQHSH